MNMQCFGALDEELVSEFESKLEVTLSESYRTFFKETGGGFVKQDGTGGRFPCPTNVLMAVHF